MTAASINGEAMMIRTIVSAPCLVGGSTESRTIPKEQHWRQPASNAGDKAEDFTISRWIGSGDPTQARVTTPSDRYFVGIAVKGTRLRLARTSQTVFDGVMPAGTLYVSGPGHELTAQFPVPFDFLHFHIPLNFFAAQQFGGEPECAIALNDLVLLRNPLAEQLARTLTARHRMDDRAFTRSVVQALAAYISSFEFSKMKSKSNALPNWRLRKVEAYVEAHIDQRIRLADLARAAGLSRMHFAAQFRAATGYRPREYLLHQRIEKAKQLLAETQTPLAELALDVGFCTQAHFSTVFKRMTSTTPAQWRCSNQDELAVRRVPTRLSAETPDLELLPLVAVAPPKNVVASLR